jgi:hypothetical protein
VRDAPLSGVDLTGLVDMHIHTAPDTRPRCLNDVEAARAAADAGMAAILLKSHVTSTADRAAIAEAVIGDVRVFGGLALNQQVGGLNPAAVEAALALGARQIWLPTQDAENQRRFYGQNGGISVLNRDGELKSEVATILELVRDAGVILGTGHLSPLEIRAVVGLATQMGLPKMLVTHPEIPFIALSIADQRQLAAQGAYFERCHLGTTAAGGGHTTMADLAAAIREVGPRSTVLATDYGRAGLVPPVQGLRDYVVGLLDRGFSMTDVRMMAQHNPAFLLDL